MHRYDPKARDQANLAGKTRLTFGNREPSSAGRRYTTHNMRSIGLVDQRCSGLTESYQPVSLEHRVETYEDKCGASRRRIVYVAPEPLRTQEHTNE